MNLTYVDRIAKDSHGVEYVLVRENPFNKTVDAKGMVTKNLIKQLVQF